MLYDYQGNKLKPYPTIVGDGVTDDTNALQAIVNANKSIHLQSGLKIKLTSPIYINIDNCDVFDGGNSILIIDGDFAAFEISGSLTSSMTANPSTLNESIVQNEASFHFVNTKITAKDETKGIGISISGCFKTYIEGCYIYKVSVGIAIKNQNRDINISNNQIYGCWLYGIHIQNTVNLHQFNLNGNMISYCYYCIYLDNPVQIANWQCTGNDIEISTYPTVSDKTGFKAINIDSGNTQSGQLSEIEICGNTIQGHSISTEIIAISGGTNRYVQHLSVTGNHISNANANLISLNKVKTASFCGNTYKDATTCIFNLINCDRITIVGESGNNVGSLINADSDCTNIINANNNV